MAFVTELEHRLRASYPLLWVETAEEDRVVATVLQVAQQQRCLPYIWTRTKGLVQNVESKDEDTVVLESAVAAMDGLVRQNASDSSRRFVFILLDAHSDLVVPDNTNTGTPAARAIRDAIAGWAGDHFRRLGHCMIIVSPTRRMPRELETLVEMVEFDRPTREELGAVLDSIVKSANVKCSADIRARLVEASLGLTLVEASNGFALATVRQRGLNGQAIQTVFAEKVQMVRKSDVLTLRKPLHAGGLARVGGSARVKAAVGSLKLRMSPAGVAEGAAMPRGMLLIGPPGTGKSLLCDQIAAELGWPLLDCEVGALFGSLVGESESRTRNMLALASAMSPCVLRLDEADKKLSGVQSSGASDSGTTARVIGQIMTWLQDHQTPVLVIATMNDARAVPDAFLRQGRFDFIFGIDLPTFSERCEIASILLRSGRKTRDPADFDVKRLAEASDGYTGAELEGAISKGIDHALAEGHGLTTADILYGIENTRPISRISPDTVAVIRQWVRDHAEPASDTGEPLPTPGRRIEAVDVGGAA